MGWREPSLASDHFVPRRGEAGQVNCQDCPQAYLWGVRASWEDSLWGRRSQMMNWLSQKASAQGEGNFKHSVPSITWISPTRSSREAVNKTPKCYLTQLQGMTPGYRELMRGRALGEKHQLPQRPEHPWSWTHDVPLGSFPKLPETRLQGPGTLCEERWATSQCNLSYYSWNLITQRQVRSGEIQTVNSREEKKQKARGKKWVTKYESYLTLLSLRLLILNTLFLVRVHWEGWTAFTYSCDAQAPCDVNVHCHWGT